jgi:hypothetical protein
VTEIFSDGFESGDFTAWTSTSGSPTVQSIIKHHGNNAALFSGANTYVTKTFSSQNELYIRFYFRFSALQTTEWYANTFCNLKTVTDDTLLAQFQIMNHGGTQTWRFVKRIGSDLDYSSTFTSPTPSVDTWYCAEIYIKIGNGDGAYGMWFDGVQKVNATNVDNDNFGNVDTVDLGEVYFPSEANNSYIDCVVVSDSYIGTETSGMQLLCLHKQCATNKKPYLRKYGVETTINFELYETDGTDLKTDAASATGDVTLYRDEAAVETLDADAFTDEGAIYSLTLSAAEMQAARIIICVVDQGTKAWLDKVLIVETYGNASAMHAFDLDTATQNVNVASTSDIDFSATQKTSLETAVDNGLDNAIGVAPTAGSIAERVKALDDLITDSKLPAQVKGTDNIDFGALQKASLNAATPAVTVSDKTGFSLSAAGVDAILDEVVDANAPANANSLRETINVIAAATAGKLSGAGTGTLTFKDLGDTKARITATVDGDNNRTAVTQDGT